MSELSFKCNKKTVRCLLGWLLSLAMLFECVSPALAANQPAENGDAICVDAEGDGARAGLPITLDQTFVKLKPGETVQLNLTTSFEEGVDYRITWSSRKEKIASVDDNGLVTAKKKGITWINVWCAGEHYAYSTQCRIAVVGEEVATDPNAAEFDISKVDQNSIGRFESTTVMGDKSAIVRFTPSESGIYCLQATKQNTNKKSYIVYQKGSDGYTRIKESTGKNTRMELEKDKEYLLVANGNFKRYALVKILIVRQAEIDSVTPIEKTIRSYGETACLGGRNVPAVIKYPNGAEQEISFGKNSFYFNNDLIFTHKVDKSEFRIMYAGEDKNVDAFEFYKTPGTYPVKIFRLSKDDVYIPVSEQFTWISQPIDAYPGLAEIKYSQTVSLTNDEIPKTEDNNYEPYLKLYKFKAYAKGNRNKLEIVQQEKKNMRSEIYFFDEAGNVISRSWIVMGKDYYVGLLLYKNRDISKPFRFKLVGNNKSATAPDLVVADAVAMDVSSASMTQGETKQLNAVFTPAGANADVQVTWTSSNSAVASVNASGVVTAVAPGTATITATTNIGKKTASCVITVIAKEEPVQQVEPVVSEPEQAPAVGTEVKDDKKSDAKYEVSSSEDGKKEVVYTGTTDNKAKKITIPDKITVGGVEYAVTKIDDGAFKNNKKITTVSTGKNITTIGKDAFKGCAELKTVTLSTKTQKIGSNAFNGCKKLKTITIKSTNLTEKNIEKKAFKGIPNNATIKVPKKKLAQYKKLFKKKGLPSKVKIKGI